MGEISDALKRARPPAAQPEAPAEKREVASTYRDALMREDPVLPAIEPGPPVDISVEVEENDEHHGRTVVTDAGGAASERYRHFAIRVSRAAKAASARTIVITSASRAEGKTTTACNLALALASMAGGRRVCLVELDLRRPAASEELGVKPRVGIEAVLSGEARLEECRLATNVADLDLFLAAQPCPDALERISGPGLATSLRELGRRYDLVIIDCAPVLPVPDVPLILRQADAAVAVARMGVTRKAAFKEMLALVEPDKLLGVFVNETEVPRHSKYYGEYTYEAGSDGDTDSTREPA